VALFEKLVLFALVAGLLWLALQPRYVFVVRIETGGPRVTKGKVTAAFLDEIAQTCIELGVYSGWVAGVRRGRHIRLAFSRHIPPACRQRLRNLWAL
jgi:hypothetical protein